MPSQRAKKYSQHGSLTVWKDGKRGAWEYFIKNAEGVVIWNSRRYRSESQGEDDAIMQAEWLRREHG